MFHEIYPAAGINNSEPKGIILTTEEFLYENYQKIPEITAIQTRFSCEKEVYNKLTTVINT